MQMMENAPVTVYLITGFLESGKTQFLTQTLSQDYFEIEGRTVLIQCEEGVEAYDEEELAKKNTVVLTVEDPEEMTLEWLQGIHILYQPERVIIECNGMYPVSKIEEMEVPEGWGLIQKITIVDASTFDLYLANMKPLFVEMVRNAEMVIFNRCKTEQPLAAYRRSVKVVNQAAEIIFENENGEVDQLFKEELPYDLKAPLVSIEDMDYGIWYVDMIDHPENYNGKQVEFCGKVMKSRRVGANEMVVGRKAMTCCADDLTFLGYICSCQEMPPEKPGEWVKIQGKIQFEYKKGYGGKGPVIHVTSLQTIPAPEEELVYFN